MIEIIVKNLKSDVTKINIDENASLESQSELFKSAAGIPLDAPYIKVIYTGKVLDLSCTPASYGIVEGQAIVVMKCNPPKPASVPAPAPAPVSEPAQAPAPAPAQQAPAPAPQPTVDPIWTEPPSSDTSPTYSIEQAHVILPMVFSYIMQNPNLRLLMLTNPNILNEIMVTQNFRNIVRQLLAQSNSLLNAIRTGTPANIYIGVENGASGGTPSQTANQGQPQLSMEQLTQAMNMLGMDPSMMDFGDDFGDDYVGDDHSHDHSGHDHSGHDHSHDHTHGSAVAHAPVPTSSLTTQDQQNISQLMEITGAQFQVAKQAYESSGKNMDIAASLLMQIMFS